MYIFRPEYLNIITEYIYYNIKFEYNKYRTEHI